MKTLFRLFKKKDHAETGIGTMIIFIAMVLVAGIAASVLIQTSSRLQSQAMTTGAQTTSEVATGLEVTNVQGHVAGGTIDRLAITIRPRSGSKDIDLSTAVLQLSDGTNKHELTFDTTPVYANAPVVGGIFATNVFTLTASKFGLIELQDADGSSSGATPVINRGDKIVVTVNVTATFGTLPERTQVTGSILPEEGAPGIISFRTPSTYTDIVLNLQ
jgi:archaeal flagellin FlaB